MSVAAMHFYDNLVARRGLCGRAGGDDDWHFYGNPSDSATVENYARQFNRCRECLSVLRSRPPRASEG